MALSVNVVNARTNQYGDSFIELEILEDESRGEYRHLIDIDIEERIENPYTANQRRVRHMRVSSKRLDSSELRIETSLRKRN
jgi:hypothetical protein